jgi:hypothetical protein
MERAIVFEIAAWNADCPRGIPRKDDQDELGARRARVVERERENVGLRRRLD